jgi:hypothetical protein
VGHLVQDGRVSSEPTGQGGPLAEDEPVLAVEDRAGMLHAAEWKGRGEDEVELLERIRPAKVLRHPLEGPVVEGEQGVEVGLRGAGAADVGGDGTAVGG